MQTGIAVILFILLKMCDALLYRICLFAYGILWPWWFLWPLGLERIKETANKAQTPLRRYQPAVKSATVEFHKAQCFFMLAIGRNCRSDNPSPRILRRWILAGDRQLYSCRHYLD